MCNTALPYKIIYGNYSGLEKKAVETIYKVVSSYVCYTLTALQAESVNEKILFENNLIIIGTPESNPILKNLINKGIYENACTAEGYSIKVTESIYNRDAQIIIISGFDEKGVLYGAVDFDAYYIPFAENTHNKDCYFTPIFSGEKVKEYEKISAPDIKRRGLWTWGHVIYDYKGYIENMMKLKMNTLIIWNDYVPINIRDVIDYAHEHGVCVYLGFSWGWNEARPCNGEGLDISDEKILSHLKDVIVKKYDDEYASLDIDGIYFQSFTETNSDSINGIVIAQCVVNLVNSTASELFKRKPDLELMFGLHASSVSEKLEYIKNTDNRIMIVWEDCGAFPFDYIPTNTENFDSTCELIKKVATLRGKTDNFGVVTKGFVCLDWLTFEHQKAPFLMGVHSQSFTESRMKEKEKLWQYVNTYRLQNSDYVYDTIKLMHNLNENSMVTALVEDGMFETHIAQSVALYGEMLWDTKSTSSQLLTKVSLRHDI